MEKKGWVKLHRQLLNNPMWQKDHTAMHIFMTLLMLVDKDSGSYTCGRFQLAELTGIGPSTLYKALGRLKFAQMVTQASNNRFTTITICKWSEYQATGNSSSNTSSNNQVTTKEQQRNNKVTLNKNIKLINRELRIDPESFRLAGKLEEGVLNNFSFVRTNDETVTKWAQEIDKINRLDGYEWPLIEAVIAWSQQDNFWKKNIRSGSKLREKFENLLVNVKAEQDNKPKHVRIS